MTKIDHNTPNDHRNPYVNFGNGTQDASTQGLTFKKNKKHILNMKQLSKQKKLRAEQSAANLKLDPAAPLDSRIP